jgi:hypothetical protein
VTADPHIHVDATLRGDVIARDILSSTFGLVADAPATVKTGCDLRVPLAMTSIQPEQVTCLACREYAHRQHLHLADQVERLSQMPGSPISAEQGAQVAAWHRGNAARY